MSITPSSIGLPRRVAVLTAAALCVAALVSAYALVRIAAADHYSACVDAQSAKYPPVAVSAFLTKTTGPLKVAYDEQRRAAVEAC